MKKLFKNAIIIKDGLKCVHILINNNKIEKIFEKTEDLSQFNNINTIDLENKLVMPGFINVYSSLLKKFFYENTHFENYESFMENYNLFLNSLTEEDKYLIYKFEILNAIKNGITTICDEDLFNLPLKKAVKETGVNFVYKLGVNSCFENFNENIINKLKNENYILSLNSVLYNNEDNFQQFISLSRKLNKPIMCGGNKNLNEAGETDLNFKQSCVSVLNSFGFLDNPNNILNFCNVLDKEDYEILKQSNIKLVFSPSLNNCFGFNNANIYALKENNLIGISSFKNNYLLESFLVKNLENVNYNNVNLFNNLEVLNMFTKNNANILNLTNIGEIKEENFADFIVLENLNINNENYILENLSSLKILKTFIGGEEKYNLNYVKLDINLNEVLNKIKKLT